MLHLTIIGMGLIGTSLGMALRSASPAQAPLGPITITGYDRNSQETAIAWGQQAIDRQARDLREALQGADLVVLAVPAQALFEVFKAVAPLVAPGTVITDVTSTKAQILEWAGRLLPKTVDFIGGHPMAGREASGAAAAEASLLKGAVYCLSPAPEASPEAALLVEAMVRQAGAIPYRIDPNRHDLYVAGVSHLPFLLSALLVEVTSRHPDWEAMSQLAATGFRDVSRLASGDVAMHRDICLTNRAALAYWTGEMAALLGQIHRQLEGHEPEELQVLFEHAQTARNRWLAARDTPRAEAPGFAPAYQPTLDIPECVSA